MKGLDKYTINRVPVKAGIPRQNNVSANTAHNIKRTSCRMSSHAKQICIRDLNARRAPGASRRRPYLPEADGFTPGHLSGQNKKDIRQDVLFVLVCEAGLEVAVPNFSNFLALNRVINSPEPGILCTTQSIDFILCDSVKGQKWGQIHNQYTAVFSNKFFLSFQSGISMVRKV